MRFDLIRLILEDAEIPASCKAVDGKKCVFPFKHEGKSYSSCTRDEHDQEWCSTSNHADGTYNTWNNCDLSSCTGKETSETYSGRAVIAYFLCMGHKSKSSNHRGKADTLGTNVFCRFRQISALDRL